MQFSGTLEIAAPRDRVWEFVSDPLEVGSCGPGVQSVEPRDDDHFVAVARVGVGPISAKFTIDAEFTERTAPERAAIRARGKAPGSAVDGTAQMTLRDGEGGTTVMDWEAQMQLSGTMASLGARLVQGTTEKLIGQTFTCIKTRLEG